MRRPPLIAKPGTDWNIQVSNESDGLIKTYLKKKKRERERPKEKEIINSYLKKHYSITGLKSSQTVWI